jgi:hypothetical protein
METKRRLSELSELPGDPAKVPAFASPEDAKTSDEWAPAKLIAYPLDTFVGESPKIGGMDHL